MQEPGRILLIGNFLSQAIGSRSVGEELATHLEAVGWKILTTSSERRRAWRLLDMAATPILQRLQYDLAYVEVYSGLAFVWAEIACQMLRFMSKPFVLALHGGRLPEFARRWPGRVRRLLDSAAAISAPSRYLIERMAPHCSRVTLIPNPIDLAHYPFRQHSTPNARIVWLRAFHRIYNPSLAVKVAAILARRCPDLSLTMLGPDKGDGSLQRARKIAAELGVESRLSYPGAIGKADVPAWLQKSDVFLNTSDIDNAPVSLVEAMACGLAIVSTNVGGISFLLEDQKDALLVPPNNPEAMANAVWRLLSEGSLATELTLRARKKAEAWDWSIILPKWEHCFQQVLAERFGSRPRLGNDEA